mgnify:CR=1 FL=1
MKKSPQINMENKGSHTFTVVSNNGGVRLVGLEISQVAVLVDIKEITKDTVTTKL